MPRTTLHGFEYELFKSSRRYYKNMKHSSQDPGKYEAEWDFVAAV